MSLVHADISTSTKVNANLAIRMILNGYNIVNINNPETHLYQNLMTIKPRKNQSQTVLPT
jgi:hypothetical protein